MSAEDTIRILLTRGAAWPPLDPVEWKRTAARVAWTRETFDRWCAAQEQMDERCTDAVGRLSEAEF